MSSMRQERKNVKPQTVFWKCFGLCKGKAKRHEEFSRSGGIYTGHQRCNTCIESQEMDEAVQANKCHSEVVISEKTTANERTKRKQQDDDTFTTNVKHVHEWRNKHKGSWPNTHSNDAHERFLGNFLHEQRKNLIKQTLTDTRRKQLEKIPGFACAQREKQWNDKYLQLCAWVAKQKSEAVLPTRHSADPEEKKLGLWVMHQRAAAKQSGNQQIIMERKALLEAVAGWTWQAKVEKQYSDKCPKCNKVIEFATANT